MRHRTAVLGIALYLAAAASLLAQPPLPGELLGSTGSQGGSLITIDPGSGAGALRCGIGSLGSVTEIEFRSDGTLFGSTGGGSSNIIVVDPSDCAESLVGQHPYGAVNGLEFVDGTLYGAFYSVEKEGIPVTYLVIVDQSDGSLTPVGLITGYSPVRGLAYDATSQTMFAVGSQIRLEGFGDDLLVLDLATGQPTPVGSTGEQLGSLEFGPDGVLYAGGVQGGGGEVGQSAQLFIVDPTTGEATPVGETGFPGVSGLAFVPGGAEPILAIPTLSHAGVVLLALLLAGAGFLLIRRS